MDGRSITLTRGQRDALLDPYRTDTTPAVRLRAHVVLLLADGHAWAPICAIPFCSTATVARLRRRFEAGGVAAWPASGAGGRRRSRAGGPGWSSGGPGPGVPRDFGLCRSRWCCATLVLVLWEAPHVRVSGETVRRWLRAAGLVWRRPRPVPPTAGGPTRGGRGRCGRSGSSCATWPTTRRPCSRTRST